MRSGQVNEGCDISVVIHVHEDLRVSVLVHEEKIRVVDRDAYAAPVAGICGYTPAPVVVVIHQVHICMRGFGQGGE